MPREANTAESERTQVLLAMLRAKKEELASLLSHYLKAFVIYTGIMGAAVKFGYDENATPLLQETLTLFGLAVTAGAILACIFGEIVRRSFVRDVALISDELGLPPMKSDALPLRFVVIGGVVFVAVALAGWLYLIAG
ncbi:MAG: hypothetical protein ABIJ61_06065 [bacterium]